ncbi:MAG: diaminopimelate epimerase, partial [Acidobacteria bacterium]|nr:diaminopimelate epimerase [Acidobacteriota bacterium]
WLLSRSEHPAERIALHTRVGIRELFFLKKQESEWILRAEIGQPSFAAVDVPFRPPKPLREPIINYPLPVGDTTVSATILYMGNPQCILLVEDFDALDWMGLGAELERHAYFPDRANIGFVRVASAERIEARFWERGAGHTLASGTGSCACAVAAHLAGKTGRHVRVVLERGELEVNWRDDGMVELTGPAVITVEGVFFL